MWLLSNPWSGWCSPTVPGFMPAAEPFMTGVVQLADTQRPHPHDLERPPRHRRNQGQARGDGLGSRLECGTDQLDAGTTLSATHTPSTQPYVDGFLLAVPTANREAYRQHAQARPWCSRNTAPSRWWNAGATTCPWENSTPCTPPCYASPTKRWCFRGSPGPTRPRETLACKSCLPTRACQPPWLKCRLTAHE